MKKTILVAFSLVLATAAAAPAVTRSVPGEFATIQAAIDACNDGDAVIVQTGTYSEAINFNGKNIVVSSTDPNDPDTVAATVIAIAEQAPGRGARPARPEGSVVTFANGEGPGAVLSGFTITGGYGTLDTTLTDGTRVFWGAGIYCNNASPTITRNVITGNSGPLEMGGDDPAQWQLSYGAGIGGAESSPLITHNIIKSNSAYAGAGILVFGEPMISNNLVYGNSAVVGGGVVMFGGRLTNNTLVANNANLNGEDGLGGSIYAVFQPESSQPLILNNIVCNAASGGGIFWEGAEEDSIAFNNVWNNAPGNYVMVDPTGSTWIYDGLADRTGVNGNISSDPLFVDPAGDDYHLQSGSPCINAGDPAFVPLPGKTDIDGQARVYALIIDIGADEYIGYVKPRADAGPDQHVDRPELITLDGAGSYSYDPCAVTTFQWTQVGGPPVTLSDPAAMQPTFMPESEGKYRFELAVSDGTGTSDPDEVLIVVYNRPPVADAGPDQSMSSVPPIVTLDGSGSYDPTDDALTYRWTQVSGPVVELSDPNAAETSFSPVETGVYVFSLVVSDDLADSEADTVGIVVGNTAPVARAGSSRYAATDPVVLDGTGSYDPDGYGVLTYQWTQVSGPPVSITDADTATPTVGGFVQTSSIRKCEFQLVVNDGDMNSTPDMAEVVIVPSFGNITLVLENPPFDPNKPTFIFFSGGNGGGRLGVGPPWEERANMISFSTQHRGTNLAEHGNAIIVYLSSVAPDYRQRIQTAGFSKGGKLPIGVGAHLNTTYADSRYNVNHATLLDAPGPTILAIPDFQNSCVDGEQSWVDNYRAGPYSAYPGREPDGALTVYFPLGDHGTPITWYLYSTDPDNVGWIGDVYNHGITAGPYYSVIGPGKNLELAPHSSSLWYYFEWDAPAFGPGSLEFYDESLYPGRLPELPTLVGPADGDTVDANGVVLSCQVCQNAVGYQLLMGPNPHDLKYIISDTPTPPENVITAFPHETIYWTIKVRDQYGSTIFPDPRRLDVGDPVSPSVENVTKGRRYFLIQDAIDEATDGDEIVVEEGIYHESIDFKRKSLTLRSADPNDPAIVAATVITGVNQGPVVTFSGGEDATCVLAGFTITGADTGVFCSGASPTITNCSITGNGGAGIELYRGSNPTITNCCIAANAGAGIQMRIHRMGRLTIYNYPAITNCTIVGNLQHGISGGIPTVTNSIIWANSPAQIADTQDAFSVSYSDIQGGWEGEGNIDADPLFADPDSGDYHLKSQTGRWNPVSESWVMDDITSPCIDTGDPNNPVGDEPEPNGGRINMGAYGGTAEASKSSASWWFETTQGAIAAEGLGVILPHEHIFTDLRGPTTPGYGQADAADVVRVMAPLLEDARRKGVGVMFECSSIGVGRNPFIIDKVAQASGLPVVVPTGVYGRANFAPPEHQNMSEDELTTLFIKEIRDGIENTGIKAGFIKIATSNSPISALEEKFLRAAGHAARETGAAIASHTPRGSNATIQADILQSIDPNIRFIWVHAQNESNRSLHLQLAARGVFIEFDSLGGNPGKDSTFITAIKELLDAGHGDRIMLSHDAGWYRPGESNGGTQRPYTYLMDTFIGKLKNAGVDDATIQMITEINPIRAFGIKVD